MVAALNRILCATGGARSFFSGIYVLLEADGRFAMTVSGHPPALQLDGEGKILRRFGEGSYPLGIRANLEWTPITGTLKPGEMLLLYSDGLYEACDASDNQFGEERIERAIRLFAGAPPRMLVKELSEQLAAFCGRRPPEDDVSIAAIRKKISTA
jgi:sigma-B regulation protein RsbU (phosphoserine phosphatase)